MPAIGLIWRKIFHLSKLLGSKARKFKIMLPKTLFKLNDAKIILDELKKSENPYSYKALFFSFISHARAITYAIQAEAKYVDGFEEWYLAKQDEIRKDELLRFVHDARIDDFHRGNYNLLNFSSTVVKPYTEEDTGPPPAPEAIIGLTSMGLVWILGQGTGTELRIPIDIGPKLKTNVVVWNPPKSHLGNDVDASCPIRLCEMVINYFSDFVREAQELFGQKWREWNIKRHSK